MVLRLPPERGEGSAWDFKGIAYKCKVAWMKWDTNPKNFLTQPLDSMGAPSMHTGGPDIERSFMLFDQ